MELISLVENKETDSDRTEEGLKYLLCTVFSELYEDGDLSNKKAEGKRFAAFKLAKAIVKSDLISLLLEQNSVDFNH